MVQRHDSIPSPFDRETTVDEVLVGMDLTGTLVLITGGASGLGFENVRTFAAAGATVVVAARDPARARADLRGFDQVEIGALDLADLGSVRAFAEQFLASGRAIDALVNNAGVYAPPETRVGPGWELQFATNHLGHFALTSWLWPALAMGRARVVSVSSGAHKMSPVRWDDLQFDRGYDKALAYAQSKTAQVLFTVELDRLGAPDGVRALAVNPGPCRTGLQRHQAPAPPNQHTDSTARQAFAWKTPAQAAATTAWAATSPLLDGVGGIYLENCAVCDVAQPATDGSWHAGQPVVYPWAIDPDQARRLWDLSAAMTGIDERVASFSRDATTRRGRAATS